MELKRLNKYLTYVIAIVWLINGLFCKVLNFVPRHQEIVARILSDEYSRTLTLIIGLSEILMAIWIWSSYQSRINAILQIFVVGLMNVLELLLVPDLLLWGKLNSLFAILFLLVVWYNEFILQKSQR